jgi:photosystem II stability/assembly factor-like uncharacterized protein
MTRRRGLFAALILVVALVLSGCMKRNGVPTPPPQQGESGDDYRRHEEWFRFQRMYPNKNVPTDARRKAWESLKKQRGLSPQATGPAWSSIGPISTTTDFPADPLETGRINSIAVSPANPQLVLVGGASGGIWRSTDAGNTFVPVSDDQVDLAVGSICFSASNPSVAYAGMGDPYGGILGTGVLKSIDAGQTWTRVDNGSLPEPGIVARIRVDPTNPDRVYLAQYAQLVNGELFASGFYFSTDGGVSWTSSLSGLPRDLVISPINPHVLYLTMIIVDQGQALGDAGLYESQDGGATWNSILALPFDFGGTDDVYTAVSTDGQTIYVYSGGTIGSSFQLDVKRSTDAGQTWSSRGTTGIDSGQFGYNSYLEVDPNNPNLVYVGSRDVYMSSDGGGSKWTNLTTSWTQGINGFGFSPATGLTHTDQHALTFVPGTPNAFYIGNDGGLSLSTDGGNTYASLNSSLSLTQFYSTALDPGNPNLSYGGSQDNGVQRRLSGFSASNAWNQMITGDGGPLLINPANTQMLFAADDGGNIFRYLDDGATFDATIANDGTFGELGSDPRIAFVAPLFNDGVHPTMYFGTWRLFKSTNLGDSWVLTSQKDLTKGITSSGPDVLTAGAVGPGDPNVIYTGSSQGRVMVSKDGGSKWTDITDNLPNRYVTWIAVDSGNPSTAYVTFSGYLSGHVFETTNMGATWTDISGNLPDLPINSLLIDPTNAGTLYIGNDIGVFQSVVGGSLWQPLSNGLPPAVAQALTANQSGLIQVGTYGRGAFQIISPPAQPGFGLIPSSSFPVVSIGQSVQVQTNVVASGGFAGPVNLTASIVPANSGVSASFSPSPVNAGGSSTLNLATTPNVAAGVYTLTLTGTSGGLTEMTTLTLNVIQPPPFTLSVGQPTIATSPGSVVNITVMVNRGTGFTDNVDVHAPGSLSGLPPGIKVKGNIQKETKGATVTFKLAVTASAAAASYPLTFTGVDTVSGLAETAQVSLLVQ